MLSLSNVIRLMVLGGLLAVALVAVKACSQPPTGMERFAVKSLKKLTVLEAPPSQPGVALQGQEGEVRLSDYRGKVALVNVWATHCPPCVAEMPSLDRLQSLRGGDDFEVVTVSFDRRPEEVTRWFERNGITRLPVIMDTNLTLNRGLEMPGLPTTVLYNRSGREVARVAGEADWASPEALALVDYLIAQ